MPTTGPAALDQLPSRGRYLLLAAPWVLAAGLAVAGLLGGRSPGAPEAGVDDAGGAGADTLLPDATRPSPAPIEAGRDDQQALLPEALVLDVLATARAALGTAGLVDTHIGPHGARWPVETHVVAVDRVAPELAVATVHGLVLERAGDRWSGPQLHAVAVPLLLSPAPGVAGPAWPLAPPARPARSGPASTPLEGPDAAVDVTDALTESGWAIDAITGMDDLGGGVVAVTFIGRHGDAGDPGAHTVWLGRTADRTVLLPLTATTTTTPTGVPTGQETP